MESRRRDKLDASYITDLKTVQCSSATNNLLTENSSEMEASKVMSYESITRPVPTVPSRMVLTPPRMPQPKPVPEMKKSYSNVRNLEKLPQKLPEKHSKKSIDEPPSLFWIENQKNFQKSNRKIVKCEKRTQHSKFISVIIKRKDTVLN